MWEYRLVPVLGYPSACERPCHREGGGVGRRARPHNGGLLREKIIIDTALGGGSLPCRGQSKDPLSRLRREAAYAGSLLGALPPRPRLPPTGCVRRSHESPVSGHSKGPVKNVAANRQRTRHSRQKAHQYRQLG